MRSGHIGCHYFAEPGGERKGNPANAAPELVHTRNGMRVESISHKSLVDSNKFYLAGSIEFGLSSPNTPCSESWVGQNGPVWLSFAKPVPFFATRSNIENS